MGALLHSLALGGQKPFLPDVPGKSSSLPNGKAVNQFKRTSLAINSSWREAIPRRRPWGEQISEC
jgi:hypothetical protein